MPIDPHDVVRLFESRRRAQGAHIARMLDVQRMYDGDIMVPLPELDENERPSVANLLMQGVNQLGMRASGVTADLNFPPAIEGNDDSIQQARDQRKAVLAWWTMNGKSKKEARRARFLVAYGCGPMIVKPVGSQKRPMPYWHVLNPLATYPSPSDDKDCIEPRDVVIQRHVTLAWLKQKYPLQAARLYKGPTDRNGNRPDDTKFDLLEYNDAEETVLVVVGQRPPHNAYADFNDGATSCELLERAPNRAEMCLAVVPGQVTISRLMGNFDQIIGMFMAQAKMTAYENIAIQRGIFPQLWAVSHPNAPTAARIIRVANGKQGIIGEIEGGTIIPIRPEASQMATQAIDRYERAQRVQASIPSDWGGESAPNIRTAKRGDQVTASAVDPTLAELQVILAEAGEAEVVRAIAVEKGWYGRKTVSFYMPRSGRVRGDTFVPNKLFDTDYCEVTFALPGVDAAGIPIELGQRTQTGQMSQDTSRRLDPLIDDPEHEKAMVELEGLRSAALKGLEAGLQNGQVDPHEIALIAKIRRAGKGELEDAITEAHEQLQKEQAALPQATPGAPETQPGLAPAPPPGAPQGGSQGAPPLDALLGQLRGPTQQSPAEQQLGATA